MRHSLPARFSLPQVLPAVILLIPALAGQAFFLPGPAPAQDHHSHTTPGFVPARIDFGPGRYVPAGELPMLTDNNYSIPHVCDWNGDGMKDLLVGVFFDGNVHLFLNQGTDENPVFGEGTLLSADGEPISVGYG